jgi:hypothetical protein
LEIITIISVLVLRGGIFVAYNMIREVNEKKCPGCRNEEVEALGNIYASDMEFGEGHDLYNYTHSLYQCKKCSTKFMVTNS